MSSYCRVNRCLQKKHNSNRGCQPLPGPAPHPGAKNSKTLHKSRSCVAFEALSTNSAKHCGVKIKNSGSETNVSTREKTPTTSLFPCASAGRIALPSEEFNQSKDNRRISSATAVNDPDTASTAYRANTPRNKTKKNTLSKFFNFLRSMRKKS